jgi:hypothetical protein
MSGISGADVQGFGSLIIGAVVAAAAMSTRLAARRAEIATKHLAEQQASIASAAKAAALLVAAKAETVAVQAAATAQAAKDAADAVAVQATKAAALLVTSTDTTHSQLVVIHTLVNSTLTAMTQDAQDASRRELVLLEERNLPTDATHIAILKTHIAELQQTVKERNEAASVGQDDASPLPPLAEEQEVNKTAGQKG